MAELPDERVEPMDVKDVFDQLDEWSRYPNYQLERRADIYFAVYLRAVLNRHVCATMDVVVPELPVKQEQSHLSDKVDYMTVSADGETMLLIELKTEPFGHRPEQIRYLLRAANDLKPRGILEGLSGIMNASRSEKYPHLMNDMHRLGLMGASTTKLPGRCQLVFVQPTEFLDEPILAEFRAYPAELPAIIDFRMFAEVVRSHGDALSIRFAESLEKWAQTADEEEVRRNRPR